VGSLIRVLRQITGISAAENLVENNDGKNDERNQSAPRASAVEDLPVC